MFPRTTIVTFAMLALGARALADDGVDFFEKKVRPLLSERCFECHSPEKKVKGGLRLDTRDGWVKGGDNGPAIVPGDPEKSLLISAVRYKDKDLQMPEKRKMPDEEIAIFEQWVKMGAPDPRTGQRSRGPEEAGRTERRSGEEVLVLPAGAKRRATGRERHRLAVRRHRPIHPGEDGSGEPAARARRHAGDACPAVVFRFNWVAADAGGGGGVCAGLFRNGSRQ